VIHTENLNSCLNQRCEAGPLRKKGEEVVALGEPDGSGKNGERFEKYHTEERNFLDEDGAGVKHDNVA